MKALVTGCAGFIGSHISERLLADGHEVVGWDNLDSYYSVEEKIDNLHGLRENPLFTWEHKSLKDVQASDVDGVDWIFHNAGQPGVRGSWRTGFAHYVENNILATQKLLEAAHEVKDGLSRFVYASSSSVYGRAAAFPTEEAATVRPHSPYGVTKLAGEQLATLYGENFGLPTVILRYHTVFGPRQRPDMAIRRLFHSAIDGTEFVLFDAGEYQRDFTFVHDVVAANYLAATKDVEPGVQINIAGGSTITMMELIAAIEEIAGGKVNLVKAEGQPGDVTRTNGSTTRAQDLLGWKPQISLHDGLALQHEWHRARFA